MMNSTKIFFAVFLLIYCPAVYAMKVDDFVGPLPPGVKPQDISLETPEKDSAENFEAFGPPLPRGYVFKQPSNIQEPDSELSKSFEATDDDGEIISIKPELIRIRDYIRFIFNSEKPNDISLRIENNILYLDFQKANNIDFNSLTKYLPELKSVGVADRAKSLILNFNNKILKAKKFISDGNNFGFDLYLDKENFKKRSFVLMTPIIGNKKEDGEEKKSVDRKIVTYPNDFVGPPKIEQIVLYDPDFVGPYLFDPRQYTIYEIEKVRGKDELSPEIAIEDKRALITFAYDIKDLLGAAAIHEDDQVVIFFDKRKSIQTPEIPANKFFTGMDVVKHDDATYSEVKIYLPKIKQSTLFYQNKEGWVLELSKDNADKGFSANQIKTNFENNFGEKKVTFKSKNFSDPIIYKSELTGNVYKMFTNTENGFGNNMTRNLVDFTIKPSLQGLAIEEKSDFINYEQKDRDVLTITKLPNLQLSEEVLSTGTSDSATGSKTKSVGIFPDKSIFPFEKNLKYLASLEKNKKDLEEAKKNKDKKDEDTASSEESADNSATQPKTKPLNYQDEMFDYLYRIVYEDDPEKKSDLKLELAKYLFSKRLYSEASGVAKDLLVSNPKYKNSYETRAILSATLYLTRKYDDAYDSFSELISESQNNIYYNELKLWQYLSKVEDNKVKRINENIESDVDLVSSFDKFMQQYPKKLRLEIALEFINEQLTEKKYDNVRNLLEIVTYKGVSKSLQNDFDFINAQLDESDKDYEQADEIYSKLIKNTRERKFRAYAMFNKAKLDFQQGKITQEEAIKKMLKSQVIWRDDYFEVDVFNYVGQLYADAQEYEKALDAWKVISSNFNDTPENIFVLGKMKDIFVKLFDGGIAYSMPPLDALKVYFKFRDLTPVGEVGDRITRKVSQFFADTDMVDEAIKIIDHQIKFRSKGDDKARLVLWLSNTLANNRNLERALDILDKIKSDEVSQDILDKLKYTKALILAKQGNNDEALDMIKDDFTKPAEEVRLEVFWNRENWFGFMRIMENTKLIDIIETAPKNLTKLEVKDLMRLAVSYSAQNMADKLKELYDKFSQRVDKKEDEFVFNYLTKPKLNLNYQDFEKTLQLSDIQDFLKDYSFMPQQEWRSVVGILDPKLKNYANIPAANLPTDIKKDVVKLALAYTMIVPKDGKEELEIKKAFSALTRNFKDVRVDRFTIDAFEVLDSRAFPKNNDAIFEGKIRLAEIPDFINYYKNSSRISQLNISTRDKFKN